MRPGDIVKGGGQLMRRKGAQVAGIVDHLVLVTRRLGALLGHEIFHPGEAMSHGEMGRRRFLQAGAVGLGSMLASRPVWARANHRVRVAVIGINGMGRNHIRAFSQLPDVDVGQ